MLGTVIRRTLEIGLLVDLVLFFYVPELKAKFPGINITLLLTLVFLGTSLISVYMETVYYQNKNAEERNRYLDELSDDLVKGNDGKH